MSQLHIYIGEQDEKNAFILEEKKSKRRKQIRFFRWDLENNNLSMVYNWLEDEITTLRLNNCKLSNDGKIFICSVADYGSSLNFDFEHWCYIIPTRTQVENDTNDTNEVTNSSNKNKYSVIGQLSSWCETPYFKYTQNGMTIERGTEYCSRRNHQVSQSNLVGSSCGSDRILLNSNEFFKNKKTPSSKFTDYKNRNIEIIANKIYIDNELIYNFSEM